VLPEKPGGLGTERAVLLLLTWAAKAAERAWGEGVPGHASNVDETKVTLSAE